MSDTEKNEKNAQKEDKRDSLIEELSHLISQSETRKGAYSKLIRDMEQKIESQEQDNNTSKPK